MPIKMIVSDMDDTLLNPQGALSPRTRAAVSEAMRRGVKMVLASGRMPQAMKKTAEELQVNGPVISFNGALITDLRTGQDLVKLPVALEDAITVASFAERLGGHVQAYMDGSYFFKENNAYAQRYGDSIGVYGKAVHMPISRWLQKASDKMLVIGEPEDIAKWVLQMQEALGDRLNCAVSRPSYIEVFHKNADKANALKQYLQLEGLCPEDVAAFGDGENDLGMIALAGRGYVMSNARPPVLARARLLAPSNAEDGVACLIEQWLEDGTIPE